MFSELKKSSRPTIALICFLGFVLGFGGFFVLPKLWPGGIGIGKDSPISTKTIEKDAQGKTVKTIETIKYDDGKTLWDWGSLLGVPLSLAILGYFLQQQQQKRAEKLSKEQQERAEKFAKEQRDIADNETKEEVLQTYFDRLSVLLIDRNLIALSIWSKASGFTIDQQELLDSSLDVIRARTLSILRRFENDAERKGSVMNFLIETEIIGKTKLNLSGAELSGANLIGANLQGVDLQGAKLSGANLIGANLQGVDLQGAKLQGADLQEAKLQEANLQGANLQGANLQGADLQEAKLQEAKLQMANLQGAKLQEAKLQMANLQGAKLQEAKLQEAKLQDIEWNSETVWPDKRAFYGAKNIPEDLKKELGITP